MEIQYGPTMTNITTNVSAASMYVLPTDFNFLMFADGQTCSGATSTGNRYYCYSYDGIFFFQFYTETNTTNLTATRIGYYAYAYDASTYSGTWAAGWQ